MSTDAPRFDAETEERADGEPLLSVDGLVKHFTDADGVLDKVFGDATTVRAVDGVDLTVESGETLAVVGESGCGKSTLGQTILNLHAPTEGAIEYKGEDLAGLSDKEMRPYRRDLQMIFQDPLASLNPRQTVGEILTAPMEVHGIGDGEEDRRERVKELLERVGLKAGHIDRYPAQFSGGQQQRVGIARALTMEPELIIADEPVSALDVSVQAQILNLLVDLQEELGLSMVFIAHDLSVVRHIADRVAVMYLGQIVETAPVDELFENPQHPYTKSLLSSVPRIDAADRTDRVILEGSVPSPIDPPSGCRFHTRCPVVIPPADWAGSEEAFKDGFRFRTRVVEGEIDVDAVRDRLAAERGDVDDGEVADHVVAESFPGDLGDLPASAAEAVRETATLLVAGNDEAAADCVGDAFPSPCEQEEPRDAGAGTGHAAKCHRVDPDAPGDPDAF